MVRGGATRTASCHVTVTRRPPPDASRIPLRRGCCFVHWQANQVVPQRVRSVEIERLSLGPSVDPLLPRIALYVLTKSSYRFRQVADLNVGKGFFLVVRYFLLDNATQTEADRKHASPALADNAAGRPGSSSPLGRA